MPKDTEVPFEVAISELETICRVSWNAVSRIWPRR